MEVLRHIDPACVRFDFCVLGSSEGAYAAGARRLGARVLSCPIRPRTSGFFGHLTRTIRAGDYDVVHSHVHQFSGVVLLAAWLAGVRGRCAFLHSVSDGRASGAARLAYRHLARRLLRMTATEVMGVSASVMDAFWGARWRTDHRCSVIHLGPDIGRFRTEPISRGERIRHVATTGGPVLMHVGRFDVPKNQQSLVGIAREVLQKWPGAKFVLAGDGPLRPNVEAAVRRAGFSKAFRFLGERDDIPELLCSADVLLLPSLWEGLPGAALEALAAGVPVVGSNIPPIREIASRNSGVVMAEPTKPTEFFEAIVKAVDTPEVRLDPCFSSEASTRSLSQLYARYRRCHKRHQRLVARANPV